MKDTNDHLQRIGDILEKLYKTHEDIRKMFSYSHYEDIKYGKDVSKTRNKNS